MLQFIRVFTVCQTTCFRGVSIACSHYFNLSKAKKKKYVCLLFDENFKQGRSVDFLFYFFFFLFYLK